VGAPRSFAFGANITTGSSLLPRDFVALIKAKNTTVNKQLERHLRGRQAVRLPVGQVSEGHGQQVTQLNELLKKNPEL
jgi:hypothetical protein